MRKHVRAHDPKLEFRVPHRVPGKRSNTSSTPIVTSSLFWIMIVAYSPIVVQSNSYQLCAAQTSPLPLSAPCHHWEDIVLLQMYTIRNRRPPPSGWLSSICQMECISYEHMQCFSFPVHTTIDDLFSHRLWICVNISREQDIYQPAHLSLRVTIDVDDLHHDEFLAILVATTVTWLPLMDGRRWEGMRRMQTVR